MLSRVNATKERITAERACVPFPNHTDFARKSRTRGLGISNQTLATSQVLAMACLRCPPGVSMIEDYD